MSKLRDLGDQTYRQTETNNQFDTITTRYLYCSDDNLTINIIKTNSVCFSVYLSSSYRTTVISK